MSNLLIVIFSYLIDRKFGEFKFIKHPIIIFGDMIKYFEEKYYEDSIKRGLYLVIFILVSVSFMTMLLEQFLDSLTTLLSIALTSIIASIFVAHNMLRESVQNVLDAKDKKEAIAMLVSRDTHDMSESDIYKASIETYAENLSDGVVAPLFYLLFFGLPGIIIYKAINTMDSMVGYRNDKYENYGKVAAYLDDIVNFIPSRLTAILIMSTSKKTIKEYGILGFYKNAKLHDSPNAGHPITAAALVLGVKLGGDTSYFGKVKHKAYFGDGREIIKKGDVENVLRILV